MALAAMVTDDRAGAGVFCGVAGSQVAASDAKSKASLAKPGGWNSFLSKLVTIQQNLLNGMPHDDGAL